MLRSVNWLVRVLLFLLLLGFALKNDQPVVLSYFFGWEWHASLVVMLLCFFSAGVAIGSLAMLGSLLRQRRELALMRRELQHRNPSPKTDKPDGNVTMQRVIEEGHGT